MKINIFEDDIEDLISFYSQVNQKNEVYINFLAEQRYESIIRQKLEAKEFKNIRFSKEAWSEAEIYFLDGLQGKWKEIIEHNKLPSASVIIVSGDISVHKKAIDSNYLNLIFKSINEPRTRIAINKYIK